MKPTGASAVMSARASVPDAMDDFPTPPWATRALPAIVLPMLGLSLEGRDVWEPAANRLCMAEPLREFVAATKMSMRQGRVWTSDVFDYGAPLDDVGSFVGEPGLLDDLAQGPPGGADFIVTNPPFNLALDFALKAISVARVGVALLCRSNWAEGIDRYERLFEPHPLTAMAQFVERVPMTEGGSYMAEPDEFGNRMRLPAYRGGYDPEASTATSYAWFVWVNGKARESLRWTNAQALHPPMLLHIPPCRERLTMPDDARRFGRIKEARVRAMLAQLGVDMSEDD